MKRPNVFRHMMAWGLSVGVILPMLYILVNALYLAESPTGLIVLCFPIFWILSLGFSGIPSMFLGLINAIALWFLLKNYPKPFTYQNMQDYRSKVYISTFMMTTLGVLWISSWTWLNYTQAFLEYGLFPSLIFAMTATYAAHRYLLRLQRYYEQGGKEKRKGKPKHEVSCLEYALEEFEFYDVEEDERQRREG